MSPSLLSSAFGSLRLAHTRLLPRLAAQPAAGPSSARRHAHVSLNTLKPAKGSTKAPTRRGRGASSTKGGHTSGRGHKGAGSRGGNSIPYLGFEGGGIPFIRRIPKHTSSISLIRKIFAPLNISRLQQWIAAARISPTEPITIQAVVRSNLVHGLSRQHGIKLLGNPNPELPLPPLNVRLSRFSKKAAQAILDAGGSVSAVYHNRLSLRQELHPDRFEGKKTSTALPTRREDIEFYTNPANHGYLAGKAENDDALFRQLYGFNPEARLTLSSRQKEAERAGLPPVRS